MILLIMFGIWLWGFCLSELLWSIFRVGNRPDITLLGLHLSHLGWAVLKIWSEACALLCKIFEEVHGKTWTLRNTHLSERAFFKHVSMMVVRKLHHVQLRPLRLFCLGDSCLGTHLEIKTSPLLSLWLLLQAHVCEFLAAWFVGWLRELSVSLHVKNKLAFWI